MKRKKKWTKKQIKILKESWKQAQREADKFYKALSYIEDKMAILTKVEGIEFIWLDNDIIGIDTVDREYPLLQREEWK